VTVEPERRVYAEVRTGFAGAEQRREEQLREEHCRPHVTTLSKLGLVRNTAATTASERAEEA
jgi:hypothetical protein